MLSEKKKRLILLISAIISGLVIISIIIVALSTDVFKNKNSLFTKYILENIENINYNIEEVLNNNELDTKLKTDNYISKTNIKFNVEQNSDTEEKTSDNSIGEFSIDIDSQTDNANNYNYKNIKLLRNNEGQITTEYVKKDNTYGVRFKELFKQYILVENNNLQELFKNIGYNSAEIPNSIDINDNISDYITLTDEEITKLKSNYNDIIQNEIENKKIATNSSEIITINNEKIKANSYTINLTKEEMNNLFLKILEKLKDDEIILNKLKNIDDLANVYYTINENDNKINLKEDFQEDIENYIKKIEQTNIGNDETKIVVYQNNKNTVRTTIQYVDYEINIDLNKKQYIQLSIDDVKNSKNKTITLTNHDMDKILEIENNIDNEVNKITIKKNDELADSKGKRKIDITYEDVNNTIEALVEENIEFTNNIDMVDIEENSIKLNDLPEQNLQNIISKVITSLTEKMNSIFTQKDINDISSILELLGVTNEQQIIEQGEITETQKNRFNSKFEFLQGNEMTSQQISDFIDIAKDNIIDLQVVSNTRIKIELDINNKNENISTTLKNFLESEEKSKYKYNVSIEYDETGLSKYIVLDIVT